MFGWLKRIAKPPADERLSGEEAAAEYWIKKYRAAKKEVRGVVDEGEEWRRRTRINREEWR